MLIRLIRNVAIFAALLSASSLGCATPGESPTSAPPPTASLNSSIPPEKIGTASSGLSIQDQRLRDELVVTTTRLTSLDANFVTLTEKISKLGEEAQLSAERAFWIALSSLAVSLLITFVTLLLQWRTTRYQAQTEVANAYAEWQLKQISELYGPLRALLQQSNAMYRQMNRALIAERPDIFRFVQSAKADFDGKVFQISVGGQWTRFRTVKHLQEVYNKGYGVEPYFDDVVRVGGLIADLIRNKAGYARADDDGQELVKFMGEYLAHYTVLHRLHEKVQTTTVPINTAKDEEAVFPQGIQVLVDTGFSSINDEVMRWRSCKE